MASEGRMENVGIQLQTPPAAQNDRHRENAGFALVSLLAITPLLIALLVALAAIFHEIKIKLFAQSLCIQKAAHLQHELKINLEMLVRLNPKAEMLRHKRQATENAVIAAIATGNPAAIAVAKAARTAVIAEQGLLAAKQNNILREAEGVRQKFERELKAEVHVAGGKEFDSRRYYPLGLAVRPQPLGSPTPNYEPVNLFEKLQQQRFKFFTNRQPTECSVTISLKEKQWQIQILAASPASNSWL